MKRRGGSWKCLSTFNIEISIMDVVTCIAAWSVPTLPHEVRTRRGKLVSSLFGISQGYVTKAANSYIVSHDSEDSIV